MMLQNAVQPALPDGAAAGREAVPAFEKLELHVITTKTQAARVLFRSFGRVELVLGQQNAVAGLHVVGEAGVRPTSRAG